MQDQPAAFDLLQHSVKAVDNALQAMANVVELIDDVIDADKRSDSDKYLDSRYRKAQAYEALDHLLTTALDRTQRHKAAWPTITRPRPSWPIGSHAGRHRDNDLGA
jgi:DNA-binding transcriptional regulator YbjK